MNRPSFTETIDMTPDNRQRLMRFIGRLTKEYRVSLEPARTSASQRQRNYYFACVVQPFYEFLREQEACVVEKDQCHIELKRHVLGTRPVPTGKITLRIVPSIAKMTPEELTDYIDRARTWLASAVGIVTVDPDPDYRSEKFAGATPARGL